MDILVTGGAGFIGSHLCEFLLNLKNKVTCIDNFITGSKNNVSHLLKNPNFKLIEHNIINPISINCDQIYNLACPASPVHYQKNPIMTLKTNTIGVINMLELARKTNAGILQASTSEVYGDPLEHPQKESYNGNVNCLSIRACYDEGKRVAETLFFNYHLKYNLDMRIARIFNTYGEKMARNDGRVVSNFIIQAINNKPITVYGNGKQTRSFCYVSDLIKGLYKLMNTEKIFNPINLGNPNEKTIIELAEKIKKLTKSNSRIIFKQLPADDPVKRKPDISLAKERLNWFPEVDLSTGLKKTIEYFQ